MRPFLRVAEHVEQPPIVGRELPDWLGQLPGIEAIPSDAIERWFLIVSQHFHNERAVYLARAHGLRTFGFDARDVGGVQGARIALRESVSRIFAVLDVKVFHTKPHFDGPPVPMTFAPG